MYTDDLDKITLSLKEKWILYRIVKKKEVPYDFCTDSQRNVFLEYNLISIHQEYVYIRGKCIKDTNKPTLILTTDKAFRYFLYLKESRFKGKFQVIIAFIALIKSFDQEIYWLVNRLISLLTS